MTPLEQQILLALREKVLAVQETQKKIANLKRSIGALEGGLAVAVGGRDALAALALPEEMDLTTAWHEDYLGLRTMSGQPDDDQKTEEDTSPERSRVRKTAKRGSRGAAK